MKNMVSLKKKDILTSNYNTKQAWKRFRDYKQKKFVIMIDFNSIDISPLPWDERD